MYLSIKKVVAKPNYKLLLTFENKEKRILDVKPYLNLGRFKELKDERLFKSVKIKFDTIEWSNNLDLDPEFLYKNSKTFNA